MDADLKKLKKLVNFCRKQGISSIKINDLEFHLSPMVPRGTKSQSAARAKAEELADKIENIPNETPLTEEQVLFYSVPDAGFEAPQEVQ